MDSLTKFAFQYFDGVPSVPREELPDLVRQWVVHQFAMSISVEPTSQPCSLSIERADATLVLRYLVKPEAERLLVLLHEQRRDFCPATLAPLGLSPRECEILYWVMHGKTNPEIGVILGLSPRTIGTRLEALFRKLGVQTRPAAAMRARELLAQLGW